MTAVNSDPGAGGHSYVSTEHKAGVPLDDIPLLRALPAFWNSAGRALKVYLDDVARR